MACSVLARAALRAGKSVPPDDTADTGPCLHAGACHLEACSRTSPDAALLTASGRGQEKWGRRRSAATPPNELVLEHVGNM